MVVVAASSAPFPLPSVAFTPRRNGVSTSFFTPTIPRASSSLSPETTSPLLRAARHTVDNYVKSGMVIGLGSGQASEIAIRYLGQQLRSGSLEDVTGVPMSAASASEAAKAGVPLEQFRDDFQIDFAFDDADVIEENTLVAVIGRRRSREDDSILQQKSIIRAADEVVFMIKEEQYKSGLEGSIPVLIRSLNWMATAEEIEDMYLGDAEVWRRPSIGDAGPLGGDYPVVTREGHNILDVIFTTPIPSLMAKSLDKIDGVVDHGLVIKTRCKVVIATENEVRTVSMQSSTV